jgi:Protein kinase domain/SPOR domain
MNSTMTEFWIRCEGQVIDSYLLGRYLGGSDAGAVYATEYGADSRPAAIKVVPADGPDWQRHLARWAAIAQLSHPSLIGLFGSGHCEIEGVPLLYVVMERSDGDLAGVLPERPLTEIEAREMLGPALAALAYLHEQGFVHGGLKPSNIMAVADEVKLASDCITRAGETAARRTNDVCPAPESWDGVVSPADDVWSLGATIVQALTQRPPELVELAPGEGADAVIPKSLPEPFFDIARHCLRRNPRSRWTLAQIASCLRGPLLASSPKPPRPNYTRPRVVALLAIAGALLAATAILALVSGKRSQPGIAVTAPAPASQRVEAAARAEPNEPPRQNLVKKADNWFVVVATYAQRTDAEKRARAMTSHYPQFKAETYAPQLQSQKPYYLVVIGSNLSQKAAVALQEQARADGLAPDAYITRF